MCKSKHLSAEIALIKTEEKKQQLTSEKVVLIQMHNWQQFHFMHNTDVQGHNNFIKQIEDD